MVLALGGDYELRPPEEADAEPLHAVVEANREHLAPWMPWASQELEATRAFVTSARRRIDAGEGFQGLIVERSAILGGIGFARIDWDNRSASIGYWLAEAAQGRGLVTMATRALLDHAFGVWELNRIEIRTAPNNVRSQAVPERLGFVREGVLREAERFEDRYVDHVVYSMLARDWTRKD
jgi:ribosomal-protein-serine acetyltransferase